MLRPRPPPRHWSFGIRHWSFHQVIPLLLGIALGAGSAWWFTAASTPAASATSPEAPPLAWSWRSAPVPTRLAANGSALSAIAAWRALRSPEGGLPTYADRASALRVLLLRLPASAYPSLLATFADASPSSAEKALRHLAAVSWMELDPAAATHWFAARYALRELAREALAAWVARDARAAASWACSLPDEKAALEFSRAALPLLAETDSSAALDLAAARGETFLKQLLPSLLPVLARSDPAATLRTYGALLWNKGKGIALLRETLGVWADRDPSAMFAWVVAQPARPGRSRAMLLSEIKPSPEHRAAFAQALLGQPGFSGGDRLGALGEFVSKWTADDAAGAQAWLAQIPDAHLRAAVLDRTLSFGGGGGGPERRLPLALALPEGETRDHHLSGILKRWAGNDPSAVLTWLGAHASDPAVASVAAPMQASLQATFLGNIARDEPATAVAEWQALPAGPAKSAAVSAIAYAWGQTDPAAALRWQSEQDIPFVADRDGSNYPSGQQIYNWAAKDASAALRWAESLPGDVRSYAISNLTRDQSGKKHTPPAVAADLYAQIQDSTLRTAFVTAHVTEWLTKDPAAAKTWLESRDTLTPEQTAALLQAR